ncbi:type II secretion system F family protein [Lignipirellula cremea]|uniref:Bacterial type II secretion system protein F domain protein n=1 Tax=Lignipirellula cremea TaxID=2528010 RepID=A0A518E1P4_9BACT|nr:type II secretion system F family protein [Lignipirellula cremea]QDU98017.1 Bacterial type II secretion system protein F domain protein [Lignipirellula cremea]
MDPFSLVPSLVLGGATSMLAWWIWQALSTDDLAQADEWRFDVSRINGLRRTDYLFRLFQPVIQTFAKLNRSAFRGQLPEISREIQAAGITRYWLPEEYLGRMELIALLLLPGYLYMGFVMMGPAGLVTGVLMSGLTVWFLRFRLTRTAHRRLVMIKRRMPFLLDLLTLLMESGNSFLQGLQQSVKEFEGHAIAQEFGRVLSDMNMGKARSEAFDNMRRRLNDDEVSAIIGAILQGEELGTPLSAIFRTQADVLRVKRSQRAETLAGEAAVNMLLPGILVMASTVLIILGPFILNFVKIM